jgi:chromate transporter
MTRPHALSFARALRFWLWLGCVSFGGPAGQIAIMHAELVDKRRWISERRFLHALNYCMVLPGPEAQQLATYIGWLMHGAIGGIAAGALFVLPSLAILIALSWLYMAYGALPLVAGVLYGLKPAVTAIVLHAAWRIGKRALRNATLWAIAAAAFLALAVLHLPFPAIVIGAGLTGWIGGRIRPQLFMLGSTHAAAAQQHAPALIDDETVLPHTRYRGPRLLAVALVGLGLWLLGLWLAHAAGAPFGNMARLFTLAALLSFGGAYAVLPYVYLAAVEKFHWLSATQMIDGLALGETTPGPLIMVVAYVGFVGGWQTHTGEDVALAGVVGACVATFFTFLPSFLFILAGGPLVEATRDDLRLSAPLSAITAAVVGVIVNLALFFAGHVLWPQGLSGRFDLVSAAIGAAALLVLLKTKLSVPRLILICAALGAVLHLTGQV